MKQAIAACLTIFWLINVSLANNGIEQPPEKPQRIVSLSLCIDQVLLMLLEKPRIAAITHLAADPIYSYQWKAADSVPAHHGLAEQIVPFKPDLIIGVDHSNVVARQLMDRLDLNVKTVPPPGSLAEAKVFIQTLGDIVGEPERASEILASMQDDISTAKEIVKDKQKLVALSYGPNGFTAGKNTLKNEILETAGYRNLATELGIESYGNISLEQVVWSKPDVLILEKDIPNQNAIAQRYTNHPVLETLMKNNTILDISTNLWLCPGPSASKAILALAKAHP